MQERYLAAADLGSGKIALSVARVNGDDIQIIYYKETASDGIRHSYVFNPMKAKEALRKAVATAEDELKIKIFQLIVGLPRYDVRQETSSARMERSNPDSCITHEEISVLKEMALDNYPLEDSSKEEIYGAVAQSFSADDLIQQSESDVVGATADSLEGNFKVFVGAKKAETNIDIVCNGLDLASHKVFLPHSVAKAVLTEEEKENGVALIEMGAGVTSVTIYQGQILRYYAAIPYGGSNITTDIKYECGFDSRLAENIKLAFGACMPEKLQSMSEKILQINDNDSGRSDTLPIKYLSEIITCRAREIIEAILFKIQESGFSERLRSGIVLTGGCANLANLSGLIKQMSGYNVRIGFPRRGKFIADGCPEIMDTCAVASVGMILDAAKDLHLNCTAEIEETPAEEAPKPQEPAEYEVPGYKDNLFELEDVIVPTNKKKKEREKKESKGITWTKRTLGNLESAIENTLGGLFDDMD